MNEIFRKCASWFLILTTPIIYILLFGEVGIKLYLQTIDHNFWLCLSLGYVMLVGHFYYLYRDFGLEDEELEGSPSDKVRQ